MKSRNVGAATKLEDLWAEALKLPPDAVVVEAHLLKLLHQVFDSKTRTYAYAPITQLLAKYDNPDLDSHSIQKTADNDDPARFDARSLCSMVVVPWIQSIDSPLGLNSDPYVNNSFRVREFSSEFRSAQRRKEDWDALVTLFDHVEEDADLAKPLLLQSLLIVRALREQQTVAFPIPQRASLQNTLGAVERFLQTRSGGARLQAVGFAVFDAIGKLWGIFDDVHTEPVNASDTSSGKPADIVCRKEGKIVMACEVKDRDLNLELLNDAIKTARLEKVTELFALIRGKKQEHEDAIRDRVDREFANGMNIYLMESMDFFRLVLAFMGEDGRQIFLQSVVTGMDKMNLPFDARKEWSTILSEL